MSLTDAARIAMKHSREHPHPHPTAHKKIKTHHARPGESTQKVDPATHHLQVVEQSEKWVAQTFYGQMLKQMRQSPFKNEKFDGGRGGQAFHEMFDQQMADRMSRGAGRSLVNSLVKRIEKNEGKKAYQQQAVAKTERPTWKPNPFNIKH